MTPIAERSLHGTLVTIGPVLPEDTAAIFLWRNDAFAAAQDLPYRPVDWMSFNNWLSEVGRDSTRVLFAIRKLEEQPIIGFACLTGIHAVYRSAALGVRIGHEPHRGQGYGREAALLLLDYAWKSLNLNRVELDVFASNERAIRAYRAAGFELEGTRRRAAYIDGRWEDVAIMAVLRPPEEADRAHRPGSAEAKVIGWTDPRRAPGRAAAN